MKKLIIIIVGIGVSIGIIAGLNRQDPSAAQNVIPTDSHPAAEATSAPKGERAETAMTSTESIVAARASAESAPNSSVPSTAPAPGAKGANIIFTQAIETLVS